MPSVRVVVKLTLLIRKCEFKTHVLAGHTHTHWQTPTRVLLSLGRSFWQIIVSRLQLPGRPHGILILLQPVVGDTFFVYTCRRYWAIKKLILSTLSHCVRCASYQFHCSLPLFYGDKPITFHFYCAFVRKVNPKGRCTRTEWCVWVSRR